MERDITGRAVQSSARIVARVLERVTNKIPLGPSQIRLTPEEMKKEVQRMRGEPLLQMAQMMGSDEMREALSSK